MFTMTRPYQADEIEQRLPLVEHISVPALALTDGIVTFNNSDDSGTLQEQLLTYPERLDSGKISRRGLFTLAAAGVVSGTAIYIANKLDFVHFGSLGKNLEAEPIKLNAEIIPATYEIKGRFEMVATARVSVGVAVKGGQDGALGGLFGVTDAHYNKVLFGDFLLATDQKTINDSLIITREGDPKTGTITKIRATLNALDVFQPRVDFTDWRNFVSIRTGDSEEQRQQKIKDFEEKHENYDIDMGYSCGHSFGGACDDHSVELLDGANFLAQVALQLDGHQPDIIADTTEKYRLTMIQELSKTYQIDPSLVEISVVYPEGTNPNNPPTKDQIKKIYQDRIDALFSPGYEKVKYTVFNIPPEIRQKDDRNYLYCKLHSNAELSINLSDITYGETERQIILKNIQEYDGPKVVPNANTNKTSNSSLTSTSQGN